MNRVYWLITVCIFFGLNRYWTYAQWSNDPTINTPICTVSGSQRTDFKCIDGLGGLYSVWLDFRNDPSSPDLYMQHLDSRGYALWAAGGIPVVAGHPGVQWGSNPCVSDGRSGVIIVWEDLSSGDSQIYANRLTYDGTKQWGDTGIIVCSRSNAKLNVTAITDSYGGAIACWLECQNGPDNRNVFAQRIDSAGNLIWKKEGVAVRLLSESANVNTIVEDGAGGAIVAWNDDRNGGSVYIQRLDSLGNPLWIQNGVKAIKSSIYGYAQQIISPKRGESIIVWHQGSQVNYDIVAQKLDGNGSRLWGDDGVILCAADSVQIIPGIVGDGNGGAIVNWWDNRFGPKSRIYCQHISSSGNVLWATDGIPACDIASDQRRTVIASDSSGGAYIVWDDLRGGYRDIFGQHLTGEGRRLWPNEGLRISSANSLKFNNPLPPSDGDKGIVVTWTDYRGDGDIYGQRVLFNGTLPTPGTIAGLKYEDINKNGVFDSNDSLLGNWTILLKSPTGATMKSFVSDSLGKYEFVKLADSTYTLTEVQQKDWFKVISQAALSDTLSIISGSIRPNQNLGSIAGYKYRDSVSGTWSNSTNWVNNHPPTASDPAVIPQGDSVFVDVLPTDSIYAIWLHSQGKLSFSSETGILRTASVVITDTASLLSFPVTSTPTGLLCYGDLMISGAIVPGTSTITIAGNRNKVINTIGAASPIQFYNLTIDGANSSADGSFVVEHKLQLMNDLAMRSDGMITIASSAANAIIESGKIRQGTIQRAIALSSTEQYRFESDSTYVQFDGTGHYPETVTITTHPNTDPLTFSSSWAPVGGIVSPASNTIKIRTANRKGRWAIGVGRAKPNGKTFSHGSSFVQRVYEVEEVNDTNATATLCFRYEQSEVPDSQLESSLMLFQSTVDVHDNKEVNIPRQYSLEQNYPNPFNPTTVIRYSLPVTSHVRLNIYNILGQEVKTLVDEIQGAGYRAVPWNGTNNNGSAVSSGVYFIRIDATGLSGQKNSFIQVKKMVLIR